MVARWYQIIRQSISLYGRRWLLFGGGGLIAVMTIVQIFYPSDKLLPYYSVEGVNLGGWSKVDAIKMLDNRYAQTSINMYFGENQDAYRSPKPAEMGIGVSNEQRIKAVDYPWYLRIAPTSLLWAQFATKPSDPPAYTHDNAALSSYITTEFGDSCHVLPKNASLKVVESKIIVEKSMSGGKCTIDELVNSLKAVQMTLAKPTAVTMPVQIVPASINDSDAEKMKEKIETGIGDGITVSVNNQTMVIPKDQLVGWLDFSVTDAAIDYLFNSERASEYLNKEFGVIVAAPAGVTKVSTYDFVETSRVTGVSGQTLDVSATLLGFKTAITDGDEVAMVKTAAVAPTLQYSRTYSPTHVGLSALMQQYGETHSGTYGVAMTELDGRYRRATYNGDVSFTTASTYKLFVAYSTLLRIESGAWQWTDQIHGGRDLAKCFDDMIVVSDNECASTLLNRIGYNTITNEARAIGATSTSFLGNDGIKTTAADLALLLAELQTGQILQQQGNRDILIDAMKRNIYRQGIPKGVSGTVADKVGFLEGLLHDAGIVYASTGTYVLVIMTDGSSWAKIAELTRQIEALRIQ